MGKIYKDKKSKGCALCKPHKHGWAPKKKAKVLAFEEVMGLFESPYLIYFITPVILQ